MSGVRKRGRLGLVGRLANEGMPIHYINQVRERLPELAASPNAALRADAREWSLHLSRLEELFAEAERDIRLSLDGEIGDEEIVKT